MAKYFHANAGEYTTADALKSAACESLNISASLFNSLNGAYNVQAEKSFIISDDGKFPRYCATLDGLKSISSSGSVTTANPNYYKLTTQQTYSATTNFYIVPFCDGSAPYDDLFVPPFSGITNFQLMSIGTDIFRYFSDTNTALNITTTVLFKITD